MNKKSILVLTLALTIVGSASAGINASQNSIDSTKNKVVAILTEKISILMDRGFNENADFKPGGQCRKSFRER